MTAKGQDLWERRQANESLREAAHSGDLRTLTELLTSEKVEINSQNAMNSWTALHWAAKRGHPKVVSLLLSYGADPLVENNKGETPFDVTTDPLIKDLLLGKTRASPSQQKMDGAMKDSDISQEETGLLKKRILEMTDRRVELVNLLLNELSLSSLVFIGNRMGWTERESLESRSMRQTLEEQIRSILLLTVSEIKRSRVS